MTTGTLFSPNSFETSILCCPSITNPYGSIQIGLVHICSSRTFFLSHVTLFLEKDSMCFNLEVSKYFTETIFFNIDSYSDCVLNVCLFPDSFLHFRRNFSLLNRGSK